MSLSDNKTGLTPEWLDDFKEEVKDVDFLLPDSEADSMTITRWLWAIRALEKKIARLKEQKREAIFFYDNKIESIHNGTEFIKGKLLGFLTFRNLQNMATPAGTVYRRHTKDSALGEGEEFLKWVQENVPTAITLEPKIDLRLVRSHMKETNTFPPTYSEETYEAIGIRT